MIALVSFINVHAERWHELKKPKLALTRGKPHASFSSFLAFWIVSRPSYIITQSGFSSKIFRLTDLDINSKWKYKITVIWIQLLIRKISLLGIFVCPCRSSHQRFAMKKGVLKNFTKFTGHHLCQSLLYK